MVERFKCSKNDISEAGWVNGQYVARAIGAVLPKGKKYPDEYIEFYQTREEELSEEQFTDADRFWAFAQGFNVGKEAKDIDNA